MKGKLWMVTLLLFLAACAYTSTTRSGQASRMTADTLKGLLGSPDVTVIDVRLGRSWTESDVKIKGAIREEPGNVESWASKYAKDRTIVLY